LTIAKYAKHYTHEKLLAAALLCVSVGAGLFLMYPALFREKHIPPQQPTINKAQHSNGIFPSDSRQVFDRSQDMTLYSLNPDDGGHVGKDTFHDFKVLGSTRISGEQIKNLRLAFHGNIGKQYIKMLCFWPHHGIRAQHDKKTVDFIICFECRQIYSYYQGKRVENGFSEEGRTIFNDLFKRAGLAIQDEPFGPR
jgi:hypothetical protein